MAEKTNWLEYWVDPKTWQFRGDFEGMYRDFEDPWECRRNVGEFRRDLVLMMLMRGRRFQSILDIGCGLGAFTERMRQANSSPSFTIVGIDIAETAINRAREQFPQCEFQVVDVTRDELPRKREPWDLVLISEVIWYVLPQLSALFSKIHQSLSATGVLFIQQFYPAQQRFGLDFLRSPAELYERYLVPAGFCREREFLESVGDGSVQLLSLTKSTQEG